MKLFDYCLCGTLRSSSFGDLSLVRLKCLYVENESLVKTISRDLALLPMGLSPIVAGLIGRSSPWASLIVMEIAVICFFLLDGYFKWKGGEEIRQVCRTSTIGMVVGIPLMAVSLYLGGLVFGYLDVYVASLKAN
ncbi:hypothetical protein [Pseudohongiella nitratireducens]|uniref:hypothetical protein n=1 Tax=Pseudohongiella nitratireducens TaxID=1768907 RepID=UPI0030EC087C|tara:strand:+ start:4118 stop:4522 length:405 start_codon:yes stop_codon:yes gene_type:complete